MSTSLPLFDQIFAGPPVTAIERRDTGIKRAADHADRVRKEWTIRTVAYMKELINRRGFKPFLAEEVRAIAIRDGVPEPPDGRAWGHVLKTLAKQGVIRKMGYALAESSNCSPKCLWSRAVPEKEEQHVHD